MTQVEQKEGHDPEEWCRFGCMTPEGRSEPVVLRPLPHLV